MRTQRRAPLTVRLVTVTTDRSPKGDETSTEKICVVHNATFEPERIFERAGTDQARVVQPAAFNVPGRHRLNANALVRCGGVEWRVVGGSTVWLDRTNVPVVRSKDL